MARARTYRGRCRIGDGKLFTADVVVPTIIGVTKAAEMLGVPKSNISRLRSQGRMPEPVPQDGPGAPMWIRDELVPLARELAAERAARAGD